MKRLKKLTIDKIFLFLFFFLTNESAFNRIDTLSKSDELNLAIISKMIRNCIN